jgi:hypothetical protein
LNDHWQALEKEVYDTKQDVAGIKVELRGLGAQLIEVGTSIKSINDNLSRQGRTPWGHLASWAAVLFGAITYYDSITTTPLIEEQREHGQVINNLETAIADGRVGESATVERSKNVEDRLLRLEKHYDTWVHSKIYGQGP